MAGATLDEYLTYHGEKNRLTCLRNKKIAQPAMTDEDAEYYDRLIAEKEQYLKDTAKKYNVRDPWQATNNGLGMEL